MAAAKYYKRKTGININESTVCSFKKAYVDECKGKRQREEDLTVTELHPKKRGKNLLLGEKLDTAVPDYVLKLREYGCPVDTYLVVAAAKGITQAMDRTRLAEAGGPVTLTVSWAISLLKRMNFTKRRVSTKYSHPFHELDEEKHSFLSELLDTANDIPPELIFNWDQTGLNLVPTPLWTLDKKGRKRIDIVGHQDKQQITAVMCSSLVGELLPFQLVYGSKSIIGATPLTIFLQTGRLSILITTGLMNRQ